MSVLEENVDLEAQAAEDAKRLKRFKILYPLYQLMAAMCKSFSTYLNYFYTNVYMFSVDFTAIITLTSSLISWIGTPVFAAFVDGFSFKNAKYWPWVMIGAVVVNGATILIVALPVLTGKTVELMYVVFILRIILTLIGPLQTTPMSGAFPKMAKTPEDRAYFAMTQKLGRDGGKTIFGYIVPVLLIWFSGGGEDPTMVGYAITALISYGLAIVGMWLYAWFGLRGSYVEREALKETAAKKKNKVPLSAIVKTILGNRNILALFLWFGLHKAYYFIYTSYAAYVFRYVFQNFALQGTFMTIFNLTAIIGVSFGGLWTKLWKDSKRACTMAFVAHMIFMVIMYLTFKPEGVWTFMILFGCSSFFMGMLETWVLPGYANAADYGAWKTGARMDTLTMACYNLSLTACHLVTTLVGTIFLDSFGYTEWLKAYNAGTATITNEVVQGLRNLYTLAPLGLAVIALLCWIFLFNMTDENLKKVQADLAEGKTAATSQWKF